MRDPTPARLQQTVLAAARGDGDAWADLVRACSPRVFALLLRRCRDRDLAEELTQATFVKVVERLDRYEEQGQFGAWLFRIALNALHDEMRRRGRQATAAGGDLDHAPWGHGPVDRERPPLERLTHEEACRQVRLAVAALPQADQEVLHLRFTAGLSFAEIASTLDQPLGTVLARSHRAVDKLRSLMRDDETDGGVTNEPARDQPTL